MARTKPNLPKRYAAIQLTPEQKAAAREELQKSAAEAARNGAYKRLQELRGNVKVDPSFYARLREEDD